MNNCHKMYDHENRGIHPYLGIPKLVHKPYANCPESDYDMIEGAPYDHQYFYYECYMDDVDHFCCEKMCEKTGKRWSFSKVLPVNKNYPSCFHRWILYYYYKYV